MASSAMQYLKDNIWLPILIALVSFILLLLLIYFVYRLYRSCTRYDYTPLKEDLALPEKLSQARQIQRNEVRDNALLNFQFYIRSQGGHYTFKEQLPDMGSRVDKHWFLVHQRSRWKDLVVSQSVKSQSCPLPFTPSNTKTIRDLLLSLDHPYIWPTTDIDLWEEHGTVILVQEYSSSGSLKDYIYNVKPKHDWSNKYGMPSRGLPLKQIKIFGRQILEALVYLQDNEFPPHCHIQAGNVIIKKGVCRLTGYENVFLGYTSRLYPNIRRLLKEKPDAVDSISFGHLLFEMGAGRELEEAVPTRAQLNRCRFPDLIRLLEFIFDVAGDYPSLSNIAEHDFFGEVHLQELKKHQPMKVQLTSSMKALIKAAKKGKVLKTRSGKTNQNGKTSGSGKKSKKSSKGASSASSTNPSSSSRQNKSAAAAPPLLVSIPPPPPIKPAVPPQHAIPPPPPPVVGFSPAANNSNSIRNIPSVEGRGALLSDIKRGLSLKKTSTIDRSTPRV